LAGGPPGGEGCGEKAREAGSEETPWVHYDVLHGEKNVVGGDRGGDRLEESAGDLKADKNPDCRTKKAEEKGLGDENKDNGVLGESERSQKADFGSATNYISGDGIGYEKHADDESDERECCKVELKCAEHFFDFLATAFGGAGSGVGGEVGFKAFEKGRASCGNFSRGIGLKKGFDAVDLAEEPKGGLDGGNISDREVIIGSQ
jgi:hypothetical protein